MTSTAKIAVIAAPAVIIVVLSGVLAWALTRARTAEGEVVRQQEAVRLAKEQFAAAVRDAERLGAEAKRILDEDAPLRAEVDRLQKIVGKVRISRVREGQKEAVARGEPVAPAGEPIPAAAGAPACPACLVPPGSLLLGRVRDLEATTEKGNLVALTRVVIERIKPDPRTTIFDEVLAADGVFLATPKERGEPRFQVGGSAWWRNPGWTAEIRGALRVSGPFWLQAAGRFDNQYSAGVMWSIY